MNIGGCRQLQPIIMKTEPLNQLDVRVHGFDANGDNLSNINNAEEVDIKYVFPTSPRTIQQKEHLSSPIQTEGWKPTSTASYSFHNENDDDGDSQAELDEIEAIINEGEVDVKDMSPVIIPIPIIIPDGEDGSGNGIHIRHKIKPRGRVQPKPCICEICNTGFPSQQLFQLHMSNAHKDERPFRCSKCGKGFTLPTNLTRHETIHNPKRFDGEPKFACDMCDKKYHLKLSLDTHRKIHHLGYKPPKRSHKALIKVHHAIGVKNPHQPKNIKRIFKCPYCDLTFAMRSYLQKHLSCHTEDRPYHCQECGERCTSKNSLRTHLKNVHQNPTVRRLQKFRPKSMAKEPCPCTVCGKVFKVPSHLQRHMLLHTGDKPQECITCGLRFRTRENLRKHRLRHATRNDFKTFKCLICGEDGMMVFSDLRNHRIKVHRHIPLPTDPNKEKPYACGICGKPYYTRGQAMVCAILKHDPKTLRAAMFKIKCEACPKASFGYHSAIALRRHWEKEHTDKPFPVKYRAASGMYEKGKLRIDSLPNVIVNKELARNIQENGAPNGEFDFPLYTEFDLLPVEVKFFRDLKKAQNKKTKPKPSYKAKKDNITCDICGVFITYKKNYERHIKTHQKGKGFHRVVREKRVVARYNCKICSKGFLKVSRLRLHERQHNSLKSDGTPLIKRRPGRPPKRTSSLKQVTSVKEKRKVGRPRKKLLSTEERIKESETAGISCVNVNDADAVRSILGNRALCIVLSRCSADR